MDSVLPNEPPYYLRLGKKVTVNFGQPIDLAELVGGLRRDEIAEPDARKAITDRIEKEMEVSGASGMAFCFYYCNLRGARVFLSCVGRSSSLFLVIVNGPTSNNVPQCETCIRYLFIRILQLSF